MSKNKISKGNATFKVGQAICVSSPAAYNSSSPFIWKQLLVEMINSAIGMEAFSLVG